MARIMRCNTDTSSVSALLFHCCQKVSLLLMLLKLHVGLFDEPLEGRFGGVSRLDVGSSDAIVKTNIYPIERSMF